ncbi:type II toxin-antitoxin system VapC family toxin [Gluconobacter japonicus]|uniref:Twitching motility protein PilT n=1 Tax=Gluconobacter japonicus TaxID=376620 RepID=A0ABQ5WEP6_GLUJA|nr:type II toxin-antitoxin system VapC family toxin [Gluconobacter japonicus]KXV29820.1 twitching motility protein PilT [Gluconobacter japonicus]GBR28126.1 pilus retraction motor protein PilT [Gluconobacter japonicus NBRC 3271]GLQ58229.1 twitching motility protein PilT [Gluconobacter japonicus]
MKLLLDTHLLLWAAGEPDRLSVRARSLMEDQDNDLVFSAASLWEVTIKAGLGRADFQIDPHLLRRGLIENGYAELLVTGQHALAVGQLPDVHRDPFDRILVAQATVEGLLLLTHDPLVQAYPGPITAV